MLSATGESRIKFHPTNHLVGKSDPSKMRLPAHHKENNSSLPYQLEYIENESSSFSCDMQKFREI